MSLTAKFNDTQLEQIRQRANLVDEVRKVVPALKKKGKHFWACCPFHNEKSASFSVREQGDFYHCFGCGVHGDVFTLIMETQNRNFPEAVQHLADQVGIKLETVERDPAKEKIRNDGFKALARAQVFFQRNLGEAEDYLEKRKLNAETIQTFGLGYAPDSFSETKTALLNENFAPEILRETGLTIKSDKGRDDYDRFRARLMFPIHNLKDEVVGFGGRVMGKAKENQNSPKYLNSPETPFFDKSGLLYNLNRARSQIKGEQRLLLVEGYMDAIALWQQGIKTAVAPMGTAITPTQIQALWRFHNKPTVCLDGDAAGIAAATRMAKRALQVLKAGVDLSFVYLPDGEDPDSFIQKEGKLAFNKLLERTQSLEDVLWNEVSHNQNLTNGTGRAAVEQDIYMLMGEVADETMKRHLTRALKDRLFQAGRGTSGYTANKQGDKNNDFTQGKGNYVPKPTEAALENILGLACAHPWLIGQFEEALSELTLDNQGLQRIRQILLHSFLEKRLAAEDFAAYVNTCGQEESIARLTRNPSVQALQNAGQGEIRTHFADWLKRLHIGKHHNQNWQNLSASVGETQDWQKLEQLRQSKKF